MWQKAATGFEVVELVQVGIGYDRRELQNLVERGVRSGGFSVVEDVGHASILRSRHELGVGLKFVDV
jgi:phosphosulfolactate synthase (CoM biosynthesis protein A)